MPEGKPFGGRIEGAQHWLPDPAWEAWFELQYDMLRRIREEIDGQTRGKSDAFKTAIYAGLIEGLAEDMRATLHLPHTDAQPAPTDDVHQVVEAEQFDGPEGSYGGAEWACEYDHVPHAAETCRSDHQSEQYGSGPAES